jgi:hypothetical protein
MKLALIWSFTSQQAESAPNGVSKARGDRPASVSA